MDLMTLLAKLTLDKTQYDDGLKEAEKDAKDLTIPTPVIPRTDNTEFKEGLDEAEKTGNIFKDVMRGVWEGVKDAIVVTGILGLVTGIVGAMRQGISLAAQNGKAISDGAKNLRISTRAYQEYEYVLGKSNLRVKDLSTVLNNLDKLMAGKKTQEQAEWLNEIGVNAENAASREELLSQTMAALSKYNGADKGAIINWLFGSNANWDGYFSQTEDEINALKKEAEELGLIMSEESVQNAAEFNDATEKLASRLEAIKRSFGEGILPIITDAVNKLMLIVDFFTGQDSRTASEKFTDEERKYQEKIADIQATEITADTLAKTLLGMGDTSAMDTNKLAVWRGTAKSLIELIPTLSEVIDVENGTINATSEEISELIRQYSELEKTTAYQTSKAERRNIIDQKQNKITEEAVKVNNKLAEAEGKRNEAIDAYNAVLAKYDIEGIGYDATEADIQNAQQRLFANAALDEYGMSQAVLELNAASKPLTDALNEARAAQAEVDRLTADVAEGTEEFNAWVESEGAMYEGVSEAAQSATEDVNGITAAIESVPTDKTITFHVEYDGGGSEHSYAIGSPYIPYDQMALLHRGERVLTATENRRGTGDSIDYTALEDRITAAIRAGMAGATVHSYLNGRDITEDVSRDTGRQLKARRFRG